MGGAQGGTGGAFAPPAYMLKKALVRFADNKSVFYVENEIETRQNDQTKMFDLFLYHMTCVQHFNNNKNIFHTFS